MDKTTYTLVEFASTVGFSDLSVETMHATKRCIVDAVGCSLGAYYCEPINAIRAIASEITSVAPATIIGTTIRTTPDLAALVNGAMVRILDFSDDYFGGIGDTGPHPSDNIGGILATAESAGLGGKDLLLGIAIAYEVCGHLSDRVRWAAQGWDHPMCHSIATALGAGKLLGLSKQQLGNALALAVAPNICLNETRRGHLSNWKAFAGPNGSRNGLFAAMLAARDITGPDGVFEGSSGLMKQLNSSFELDDPLHARNVPFKIEGTFFKSLPVRYPYQLPIWTAIKLRERVDMAQIKSLRVYLEKRSVVSRETHPEYWEPESAETADHSGPYLIGAALVDGAISKNTFTPERYRDPTILGIVQKIHMEGDPAYSASFPRELNCRFEVELTSGEPITLHEINPKGHPGNPMSDNGLEAKFFAQVEPVLGHARAQTLLDQIWNVEKMENLGTLFPFMRVTALA